MRPSVALALALLAAPALSPAQTAPPSIAAVADPAAPVPAPVYRSALAHAPRGVVQDSQDWRGANAQVGRFRRGHADILKWEQSQDKAGPAAIPAFPQRGRESGHHHQERRP